MIEACARPAPKQHILLSRLRSMLPTASAATPAPRACRPRPLLLTIDRRIRLVAVTRLLGAASRRRRVIIVQEPGVESGIQTMRGGMRPQRGLLVCVLVVSIISVVVLRSSHVSCNNVCSRHLLLFSEATLLQVLLANSNRLGERSAG